MDAQAGAPEHDDQPAQPAAVHAVAGGAHDGDDLLDGWWVCGVADSLVARRPAWKSGRVAGERRRPAASSSSSDMTPPRASDNASRLLLWRAMRPPRNTTAAQRDGSSLARDAGSRRP